MEIIDAFRSVELERGNLSESGKFASKWILSVEIVFSPLVSERFGPL